VPGGSAVRLARPTHIAGIVGQPIDAVGTGTELLWKELSVFGSIWQAFGRVYI